MVIGAVSVSLGAVSPRLLKMTGEQRIVFRASLLALGCGDGSEPPALIPPFGATGCAVASVVAVTLGRVDDEPGREAASGLLGAARQRPAPGLSGGGCRGSCAGTR
jgi:hypothetical protein